MYRTLIILLIFISGVTLGMVASRVAAFGVEWLVARYKHCSLRDLLIAMTVFAVLLGAVVYVAK